MAAALTYGTFLTLFTAAAQDGGHRRATLNPVITVGLAVVLLGERLARRQQLGVPAALAGVPLLAAG